MATSDESIKRNISRNIVNYRELAKMSQKELASKLDVSPSRVSNWEQGANCPTIDILFEVCKILNVSINDIYGIYPESTEKLSYEEITHIKKYRTLDDTGRAHVDTVLVWETERMASAVPAAIEIVKAPSRIVSYYQHLASAGTGQVLFDDIPADRVRIPDLPQYARVSYAIGVNGHSMEPLYQDGDMLLVEPICEIEPGEIGIFIVGNEAFVKQLGRGELISLNSDYSNIPLTSDSKCMGRVVDHLNPEEWLSC